LTKLPLHVLKLDKEFLRDFEKDSQEKIIIPSIIDMAKKLSLDVVCEGVETKEQVEFLRSVGCDYAQGYFYSKPIPMEEFSSIMKNPFFILIFFLADIRRHSTPYIQYIISQG
jgi:sensor c-di-GMP phosphodiesterase-like protein